MIVQTSPEWWNNARSLKYVDSQAELDQYSNELDRHSNLSSFDYYWNNRRWLGLLRLAIYKRLFNFHFGFTRDYDFFRPGLEMKFACESAEKVGAKLEFMGPALSNPTWQRLLHETRFNVPEYLVRRFQKRSSRWYFERYANQQKINMVGPAAFTEKCLDASNMNWYIQSSDVFFPKMKKILVDERDDDLF